MTTGNEALRAAIARLRAGGIDDAALDARILLAHALPIAPDRLTLHLPDEMTAPQARAFEEALVARLARQPVAQIIGQRQFWGLTFRVTQDTLDPRPDTEALVAEAVKAPFLSLLDLGTGTGCILLACLKSMPMARGLGVDISPAALAVAEDNAARLGLQTRASFRASDWFSAVPGRYDLIVSNPPYIAAEEMAGLAPEVRDWEPHLALTPGGDGLEPYRILARGAPARLMAGGRLLVEIGWTQGPAVAALFAAQGLQDIRILPDMEGRDRVVAAVKPGDGDACGCA
ncbi:peptide chain release factor N(5)-glutamine methyltransferase [Tabrizicola oligotrophica]|uniref:Release factor glutamine methyltransferase n=1 Tax=Tabrizicola oligotrophica TaxID=2710650 RepID=A0A6M0QPF7_9RHOB|nr:peptide chain release factor N(5)-glutamine methyltransferase [Tabrizicola oligotrophica]NEY89186.1 peptide chain release factor N(5)-glutamine methyltransferase [Tabrizicola oligotrophica]